MDLRRSGRVELVLRRMFGALLVSMVALVSANVQQASAQDAPAAETAVMPAKKAAQNSTSDLLPTATRFWVSVEDLRRLETNIANTQIGKLSRQATLAPFFSSFEKQIRDTLNKNGIKFGLDIASVEQLQTGEVSIAGVLPDFAEGEKPVPGSHGVVVLIDVSPDLTAAEEFLSDAAEKMKKRGAKLEEIKVLDTGVSKWTIEVKAAKVARKQTSFVTIVDGWIMASDNESIFTNVLRRIKTKDKGPATDSLTKYEPFMTVNAKTRVESVRPDLKWFVDPLGYARFADALDEERSDIRKPKDRPLETLSKEGLDALKAAGGFVSFSTGEHDMLHRSLVYANQNKADGAAQKRLFNLLDFAPPGSSVAEPPAWVPVGAAGYTTFTWDISKAFENIGPMFDAVTGEGNFDAVLEEMKKVPNFKVDIRKMAQSIGSRITVVASNEEPVSASSEKMIIGIDLKDGTDAEWMIQSIGRAMKAKIKKLGGYTCVIDDRTVEEEEEGIPGPDGDWDIDKIEQGILDEEDDDELEEEVVPRITILNRRIIVVRDGTLFISNDKDYLKKFLAQKPTGSFAGAADFTRMGKALDKVTNKENVRFRMFDRLDQLLKLNYEMMRTGKMVESETFLARILNQIHGKQEGADEKRKQRIDGSDLPADFDKEMAPFLGQSGLAMETTDFGWRFSGCVLPKEKPKAKVAEAPDSSN